MGIFTQEKKFLPNSETASEAGDIHLPPKSDNIKNFYTYNNYASEDNDKDKNSDKAATKSSSFLEHLFGRRTEKDDEAKEWKGRAEPEVGMDGGNQMKGTNGESEQGQNGDEREEKEEENNSIPAPKVLESPNEQNGEKQSEPEKEKEEEAQAENKTENSSEGPREIEMVEMGKEAKPDVKNHADQTEGTKEENTAEGEAEPSSDNGVKAPEVEEEEKENSLPTPECPVSHEEGRTQIDTVVPCNVDTLFNMIFTDHKFFKDLHAERKTFDMVQSDWPEGQDGTEKTREISFTVTLDNSVGPKTSRITETQVLHPSSCPGQMYVIEVDSVNGKATPYHDSFSVFSHFCLTRISPSETKLVVVSQIKYMKSVNYFVKKLIERNAWAGLEDFYSDLEDALEDECENMANQPPPSPDSTRSKDGDMQDSSQARRPSKTPKETRRRRSKVSKVPQNGFYSYFYMPEMVKNVWKRILGYFGML